MENIDLNTFIKWEAFTPGKSPEHGQEVITIHKDKEEQMMYDSKYAAFLRLGVFKPDITNALKCGFPEHGANYCLGAKYQEYVTHWKPKN